MNTRGFFMTFGAVIILAVLLFIFILSAQDRTKTNEISVQYRRLKVTTDYLNDLETVYLPGIVQTSEKFGLRMLGYCIDNHAKADCPATAPVVCNDIGACLQSIAMTGELNGQGIMAYGYTVPGLIELTFPQARDEFQTFSLEILDVAHADSSTVSLQNRVKFVIVRDTAGEHVRWEDTIDFTTEINVMGLTDPQLHMNISSKWSPVAGKECYLRLLDSSFGCNSVLGLCPLGNCNP